MTTPQDEQQPVRLDKRQEIGSIGPMQPLILLTNDDGIHSKGLNSLFEAMQAIGRCLVVAPDRDNSAVSHSLTMHRPLRLTELGRQHYTVDGTPTDCVALALNKILPEPPDLLVSGINPGLNIGDDISYSGTVLAAVEATMYGIKSMAVSTAAGAACDFQPAAAIAARLAETILQQGLPADTLLNVNVPAGAQRETALTITRQGRRFWENAIQETTDPWGRPCYWIGGGTPSEEGVPGTDTHAISQGEISITPIHLDLTNHDGIDFLKGMLHGLFRKR